MMKKRFWALFLAVMMVVSVLPTSVFAEASEDLLKPADRYYTFAGKKVDEDDPDAAITLSKTAEYIGDGKYEITLTANAEQIVMPKATEVVFVLDASSSMNACTKANCGHDKSTGDRCDTTNNYGGGWGSNNAVEAFDHPESRWVIATDAIADMKEALGDEGISYKYVAFGSDAAVYTSYEDVDHSGINYTYLEKGVELGLKQFSNNDTNKVLIIVSDGAASDGYEPDGLDDFDGEVYAVGFTFSNEKFQKMADEYFTASDADELSIAMDEIAENIVGLITDPMGDSVDLLDTTVEVTTDGKPDAVVTGSTINWTDSEGLDGEVVLNYEVEIKSTKQTAGSLKIPLNGAAKLNYAYNGEDCSVDFPTPIAIIKAATLDVDYMLGDEQVDNDHEWINLTEGEEFETTVPEVGDKLKINKTDYWVIAVKGEVPSKPGAEAYEVTVTLTDEEPVTEYTVTYSVTGDVPAGYTAPTGGKYKIDETVTVADVPSKNGYTFEGWKKGDVIVTSFKMPANDVELTGVWSAKAASVTWYVDDVMKSKQEGKTDDVVTGYTFTAPAGYTFDGWYADAACTEKAAIAETMIGAISYYGKTTPNTNTAYKVEHYQQKLDGTGYDLTETENLTGTTGITATATAKTYTGFTFDATVEDTVQSGVISGDGNLVLKLYYTRNSYTVIWKNEDGTILETDENVPYGATPSYNGETPAKGADVQYTFQFNGWTPAVTEVTEDAEYWATYKPATELEYTFTFDANGGAWDDAVDGYTMNDDKTQASKKYKALAVAEEIVAPVREGYDFVGWYMTAEGVSKVWFVTFEGEPVQPMIIEDTTVYAKWVKQPEEPTPPAEKSGNLYVNLQDENGTWLGGTDTGIVVTEEYLVAAENGEDVDYVYPASVEYNGKTYIYEGPVDYSAALSGIVETADQNIFVILQYTLDELNDEEDKPTGGDNIPDKYQAIVTYKVVNGTWSDDTTADIVKVFTLKTLNAETGEWTDAEVSLGEMPTGMKPAAEYINKGEWDKTHAAADKPVHGEVYTYTFTTTKAPSVSITKTADKTNVKVGDKVTYTIVVENKGNVELTDVVVTDTFVAGGKGKLTVKSGSLEIGTLAVGETATIVMEYTTVADDVKGLKNQAEVDANEVQDKADTEEVKVTKKNDPVKPVGPSKPQLNKADHYAYIVGYPDGLVHPEKNITRAEVATIFFRMLLDESREDFWAQENWFFDVMPTDWFNNAVSTLANANLINGYPDGNYRPNANITRAEFATIAIRFFLEEDVEITENNLSDVKGHWAEANIDLAYALNLINGYPDGTFRPDQQITRAEAMTIVNRVLERAPHKDHLLDDMIEWPDNMDEDIWYYADVQEATNSHEFYKTKDKDEDKAHEIWTELLPVRDWVALEQAWSAANSSKNPGEVVDIKINTP